MVNYILITLLALNLIGTIFLIAKKSGKKGFDSQKPYFQNLLEMQQKMTREMAELKAKSEHIHGFIQEEFAIWRAEHKALVASLQKVEKSKTQPNLQLNDRYKEIFELHQQGLSVEEIAKELEKGVGEVAFILQLASNRT